MQFQFDPERYAYPSRRMVQYARRGMVCTSQALAAQIGLDALKQGGNAVDAAIATAIAMTVLEPTSNGIGGDAFALVWTEGKLYGLNASGPSPALIDADILRGKGFDKMPLRGWETVNVPGTPAAWAQLSARFGRLPFAKLFEGAISYAREGFPLSPTIARLWKNQFAGFSSSLKGDCYKPLFETFTKDGETPEAGRLWRSPLQARTLQELAKSHCESFYRGEIAARIDAFAKESGGYLRKDDLAAYQAEWVEPIHIGYKGYDVWEIPPNGHGIIALMALGILGQDTFDARDSAQTYHRQIEALKLAFTDGRQYIADPRFMQVSVDQLLSADYLALRRKQITQTALQPFAGDPNCGGTIYLCTADEEGNMVSYIQSNYKGFGSGIVLPDSGIALNNRGYDFNLTPGHPNCLAPRKKSYHTIIPGFLTRQGEAVGPFGVMGGFMQPQGHMQVIMNTVDFHMNPAEALDAPRWQWAGDRTVEVEHSFPNAPAAELLRRGHNIKVLPDSKTFGRGQIIWRDSDGTLAGATEPRADGTVAVW